MVRAREARVIGASRLVAAMGAGSGSWLNAVASVLGGRSLAAAAAFLGNFLVLLQLGPVVFATFYLLFTIMSLVAGLTGPAIDTTLVRFAARHKDDPGDGSLPYFKLVFLVKVGILLLTMGVALMASGPLVGALFSEESGTTPAAILLAFAGGAVVSMWGFSQSYFLAHQSFGRYAGYEFCSSLLRLGLVMALMVWNVQDPLWYLVAYVTAPLTMALLSWSELPRVVFTTRTNLVAAGNFYRFGRWVILASLFTTLAQRLDILLLGYFGVSQHEVGLYSGAVAIVLAGELVLITFHSVLLPKASTLKDPGYLRIFIGQFRIPSLLFSLVLTFMVPVIYFFTRLPTSAVADAPWLNLLQSMPTASAYYGTAVYFTILLMGVIVTIACSPAIVALYSLGHSWVICSFEGARLVLTLALGVLLAARYGAYGMAWAVALVRCGISVLSYVVAHQWVKREMLRADAEGAHEPA
jgi:O-antigen/teichoic acid export membrane protein